MCKRGIARDLSRGFAKPCYAAPELTTGGEGGENALAGCHVLSDGAAAFSNERQRRENHSAPRAQGPLDNHHHGKQLADRRNGAVHEIDKLGGFANACFIANQQGDLIYVLGLQDTARIDIIKLIYQGNVLDRAEPVRNLIGALAIDGLVSRAQSRLSDLSRRASRSSGGLCLSADPVLVPGSS